MRTPAVALCLAFTAGVVLPAWAGPVVPLVLAGLGLLAALTFAARSHLLLASASLLTAFLALGNAAAALRSERAARSPLLSTYARIGERGFVDPLRIEGRLRSGPERFRDATVLSVEVEELELRQGEFRARGGLRASVRGERRRSLDRLASGDRIRFWGRLRKPAYFRNPGGFDGPSYDARRDVDLYASVKSGLLVQPVATASTLTSFMSRSRRRVLDRLERSLPAETFGVVAALVTGERSALSRETERVYQRAGTFHVMAISGAHVAIWILFFHFLFRALGLGQRATLLLLLVALPLYAVFCGSRAPVLRAVVMASIVIGARLASLRSPAANGVSLAALVLLARDPDSISDPGFQLTFAAVTAIGLYGEKLSDVFVRLGPVAKPLGISLAAQLGVVPVACWHFHRLSPVAPVASVAAMPVAAGVCILGLVLVVVAGVPLVSTVVGSLTHHAVLLLNGIAALAAEIPGASLRVGPPSIVWLVLYAVALVAIALRWRQVGALLLTGLMVALVLPPTSRGRGVLEIAALDVGHGDAMLLSLPEGGHVLVDGGGLPRTSFDVGETVVLPFLLAHDVRLLDAVVVSHADFDHVGGLVAVIDELRVGEIWEGEPDWNRAAYRALRERAANRGVPVRTLSAGDELVLGGVRFEVLSAGGDPHKTANDRSLVLRLTYGGRRVLLTGDAEAELEEELVGSGTDLRADVLKLAHHGSRSSTTERFLDAVQPEVAIVSARRNDARPLPSPRVLHRLRSRAIEYARTDEHGTVTVTIDGEGRLEVSTFRMGEGFSKGAESWELETGS